MPILDGIFGFPARPRVATVGAVVVGALSRFVNAAGRIAASLVTVDDSGNVTTPGRVDAASSTDGAARASSTGTGVNHYATFGHSAAPAAGFRQRADGVLATFATTAAVCTVDAQVPFYMTANGIRAQGPTGSNTGPGVNMALHVGGGFFFPPRLDTATRDTMTTELGLDASFGGVMCFNTTVGRLEMWDGAAWVGISTVP